jgi:hypothetical protein
MKRFVEALIIAVIVMSLILPQGQKTDITDMNDDEIVKDLELSKIEISGVISKQLVKSNVELVINPVFEPPGEIPRPPPDVSPM